MVTHRSTSCSLLPPNVRSSPSAFGSLINTEDNITTMNSTVSARVSSFSGSVRAVRGATKKKNSPVIEHLGLTAHPNSFLLILLSSSENLSISVYIFTAGVNKNSYFLYDRGADVNSAEWDLL